ncbi:MAG: cyclase family protein [Gemmatimonadaceae bacterium]
MTVIDISTPLQVGMHTFPGDPAFSTGRVSSLAEGGVCNLGRLALGAHAGTHIDAPMHYIEGAGGIETFPLDAFCGPVFVLDATSSKTNIDRATLDRLAIPPRTERLVFRTRNSNLWELPAFSEEFVALLPDAAAHIVARGIRLVGIDYLSIAPFADPTPTHVTLLAAGVVILEGLDLRDVEPGEYELLCLPLRLEGIDGVPARVLLRR